MRCLVCGAHEGPKGCAWCAADWASCDTCDKMWPAAQITEMWLAGAGDVACCPECLGMSEEDAADMLEPDDETVGCIKYHEQRDA